MMWSLMTIPVMRNAGMLHSSAKPAPITAQDANNEKGLTTRSKMHVSFNDDTKNDNDRYHLPATA